MKFPNDLRYAESHEWIRPEGAVGVVGISDHAQSELGDVVFVELPKVGADVKAGQAVAVVESVKAASDIYAPVGGKIVEVNEALEGDPSLINSDPYGSGWIFKVSIADAGELTTLGDADDYQEQLAEG